MKKTIVLIASMTMATIWAQASEAPASMEQTIVVEAAEAAPATNDANESNATKEEAPKN